MAEEQYLYPAARTTLPNGDRIAEHEIAEHAEAEDLMQRLDRLDASTPDFDATLRELIAAIRHHVRDEEEELFPLLRTACPAEELHRLAAKVQAVKKIAPTRPHPTTPDRPPANRVVDAGAGLVDRVRDTISRRPTTPDDL